MSANMAAALLHTTQPKHLCQEQDSGTVCFTLTSIPLYLRNFIPVLGFETFSKCG